MSETATITDPWTDQQSPQTTADAPKALDVQTLTEAPEATTSPVLADALFAPGQNTFAILDAAKIPNLPEILEGSGLPHRCLFKGRALNELQNTAPWMVQLTADDGLTRNLMAVSDAPWDYRGKSAGIFLRSAAPMDALWQHFRKFTKAQDAQGRTLFFRYWDAQVAKVYFAGLRGRPSRVSQFFYLPDGTPIDMLIEDGPERAVHLCPKPKPLARVQNHTLVFDLHDETLLQEVGYDTLTNALAAWLPQEYPDALDWANRTQIAAIATHVVRVGRQNQLRAREDFAFLAQMMMTSGAWFVTDGDPRLLQQISGGQAAPAAADMARAYAAAQAATPQGRLMAQWPDVRQYLAGLPDAERISPDQFRRFVQRFLSGQQTDVTATLSRTMPLLPKLGLPDQNTEGQVLALTLILGPRFYEDPFKPWARRPAPQAIAAAWAATVG